MKSFLIPKDFSLQNEEHVYTLQQALYALDKANIMPLSKTIRGINGIGEGSQPSNPPEPSNNFEQEIETRAYGTSTQELLSLFQETFSITQNVNYVLPETVASINKAAEKLYRICGCVTNDYGVPIEGVAIKVFYSKLGDSAEIPINNPHVVSLQDGTFCAYLDLSVEELLNKKKKLTHPICVVVQFTQTFDASQPPIILSSEKLLVQEKETIINFSSSDFVCTGKSHYASFLDILKQNKIENAGKADLTFFEGKEPKDLLEIAAQLNVDIELVLRVMLAAKNSENPENIFGFLYQGYPLTLPAKLFIETEDLFLWESYLNELYNDIILRLSLEDEDKLLRILIDAKKFNYISSSDSEIANTVTVLKAHYDNNILNEPLLEGKVSLSDFFAATGLNLSVKKKEKIAKIFTDNLNDFKAFIDTLNSDTIRLELNEKSDTKCVDKLIYYFEISRIVRNLPEMIVCVRTAYPFRNSYHEVRKLSKLSLSDWESLVSTLTQIPSDFSDIEEYSEYVFKKAQMHCPSLALIARSSNIQYKNEIEEFLFENPDIDLLTLNIDDFIANNAGLNWGANSESIVNEIRRVQSAYRIAPTPKSADVLLENDIADAGQIYFIGKSQLENDLKDQLPQEEISSIYKMATARFANALVAYTNMNSTFYKGEPKGIPAGSNDIADKLNEDFPNIKNLFGDPDFCECDYDSSVYSAPAYLSDILAFLDNRKAKPKGSNKKVKYWLDARRQDISKIYLSKQNATTVMPYIDLVNEVLEEAVLQEENNKFCRDIATCQSTLSAAELCAAPEHLLVDKANNNKTAYDIVSEKMYPMYAPLNLPKMQILNYLKKMSAPRHEIMSHFRHQGNYKKHIAREFFELTPLELNIILKEQTPKPRNTAWRNTEEHKMTVKMFLEDSGLSVHKLMDILRANWIHLIYDLFGDNCLDKEKWVREIAYENETIGVDYAGGFDRAHRFIRLLNKTNWSIAELNLLLQSHKVTSFDPNKKNTNIYDNLDANALYNLMLFKQQQEKFKMSCEELLACYDYINPNDLYENGDPKPCLFKRIFLLNTIEATLRTKLEHIQKKETNTTIFSEEDERTLAACLSISYSDFLLLQEKWDTGAKNIAFLSYLYRHISIANLLKVSIKDLLLLYKIFNINIKYSLSIEDLPDFLKKAEAILSNELSLEEFDYLISYNYQFGIEEQSNYALTIEEMCDCASNLKAILNVPESMEVRSSVDNVRKEITAKIAEFFSLPYSIAETYLNHKGTTSIYPSSPANNSLYDVFKTKENYTEESITAELFYAFALIHKAALLLKKYNISSELFKQLYTIQEKIDFKWHHFSIINNSNTNLTITHLLSLASWLNLNKKYYVAEEKIGLLDIIEKKSTFLVFKKELLQITKWEQTDFEKLSYTFGYGNLTDFYQPSAYVFIEQSFKYKNKTGADIKTLLDWCNLTSSTDINQEKRRCGEIFDALKSKFDNATFLKELEKLNKHIREAKSNALSSYLVANDLRKEKGQDNVWFDKADLYGHFLLDTEMTAAMKTSRIVQATNSVQLFVQRCMFNLESEVIVDDEYDTEWKQWEWLQKYRLWEANRKVFLYPENWIEPELRDDKTPLFKELEDELNQGEITDEHVENCYANYLNKLDEVSNLTVCATYHEVVKDEPLSILQETQEETSSAGNNLLRLPGGEGNNGGGNGNEGGNDEGDDEGSQPYTPAQFLTIPKVNTLHVIARSKTIPYIYYYRAYDGFSESWTPWEKINVDIQGDLVVPFVYNKRLHLFWIRTVKKAFASIKGVPLNESTIETEEATNYTEIQVGWSVFRNKKWSPAKYSHKKHLNLNHDPETRYSMIACKQTDNNDLLLKIFSYVENVEKNVIKNTGDFIFNGDVCRSISYVNNYGEKYLDLDLDEMFNNFAKDMNFSEKPEKKLLDANELKGKNREIKAVDDSCKMYNNKLYLFPNDKNIWLHDWREKDDKHNIITTTQSSPHLVTMVHNYDNMEDMLYKSHLFFPFFYQDSERSFFVRIYAKKHLTTNYTAKFEFSPFYHPFTKLFMQELDYRGLGGLLNRDMQINPEKHPLLNRDYTFKGIYSPNDTDPNNAVSAANGYDKEVVDFNYSGGYATYNWELFFHVPLYIACKLNQNQKFEEAMKWFHTIFNPMDKTDKEMPAKFWVTKPFFEMSKDDVRAQDIRDVLENIHAHVAKVTLWLNNPYNPHLIARARPVAFQRAVVMKYIDNIIAWADQLFRRDTIEENNKATMLYVLAYQILGKRPVINPKVLQEKAVNPNYIDIKNGKNIFYILNMYDEFIQYKYEEEGLNPGIVRPAIVNVNYLLKETMQSGGAASRGGSPIGEQKKLLPTQPVSMSVNSPGTELAVQDKKLITPIIINPTAKPLPRLDTVNFCVPFNQDLLRYWDIVEDRLFKLRNCMNIDGIVRELPLFEPPIDPAMLVKAAAAGISIGDALNNAMDETPHYRFRVILQKAIEFTNEVKQFGDKLLSALEKKDAEVLSALRNVQEINMQQAALQVRKLQIEEALKNIDSINESIKNTAWRQTYYANKEFMNSLESEGEKIGKKSIGLTMSTTNIHEIIAMLSLVPTFNIGIHGFGGSPALTASWGIQNILGALGSKATALSTESAVLDKNTSQMLTKASYQRRKEDWDFQAKSAQLEINQLNKQLIATEIRLMIAEKELANAEMQIEQSLSIKEYYETKYTNETLYNWMTSQIVNIYFQAYQLAYDMAKKAEKCYVQELGLSSDPCIITFGHWNSLNKGLLAGDRLIHQLHELDAAYIENNKRTFELTKHISLAQMFPDKLLELISTKSTIVNLKEWLFDMDYPGQYMRRIKSVAITIPNVSGPNTNVSLKLSLTNSTIRKESTIGSGYKDESNFMGSSVKESICTSSAQNDSGLFELNFGDERYLPFENAGAISDWSLEFTGHNQFDLSTVSDVILHINYTALSGSQSLMEGAKDNLQEILPNSGVIIFSPKQDFSDEWNNLSEENISVKFEIQTENIPFYLRGLSNQLKINNVICLFTSKKELNGLNIKLKNAITSSTPVTLNNDDQLEQYGDLYVYKTEFGFDTPPKVVGNFDFDFDFSGTAGVSASDIEECIVAITINK